MTTTRPALHLIGAERRPSASQRKRVLHPTSALARRAGITAVTVPDGMWVAPSLLSLRAAVSPERHLRAVA